MAETTQIPCWACGSLSEPHMMWDIHGPDQHFRICGECMEAVNMQALDPIRDEAEWRLDPKNQQMLAAWADWDAKLHG